MHLSEKGTMPEPVEDAFDEDSNWLNELENKGKAGLGKKRWLFIGRLGKKRGLLIGGLIAIICVAIIIVLVKPFSAEGNNELVYREYTVAQGDIIVGQTESSPISLEKETISFPLEAMVEEVYIKEGASVKEGDPLLLVNVEDVAEGLDDYELELEQAGLEVQQAKLDQQTKLLEAAQDLETSQLEGSLADNNKVLTISELQDSVNDAQEKLLQYQEDYAEYLVLSSTYEDDYEELLELEEDVEYYQDKVDEYQSDISIVNNYQSIINNNESQLQQIENAESAVVLVEEELDQAWDDWQNAAPEDQAAFEEAYYQAEEKLEDAEDALDNLINKYGDTDDLEELIEYYTDEMADYGDADLLSLNKSEEQLELEEAQSEYDEYKAEFTDLYGNISGEGAMNDKLEETAEAMESAQTALTKAELNLTAGLTEAEQKAATLNSEASTAYTQYQITSKELQQKVDEAQESYDELAAEIEEMKLLLSEDGVVYAPFDGMIASVHATAGESISIKVDNNSGLITYADLVTLTDISSVYVPITISEEDILNVSIGQEATVTMTAFPNQTFAAEVDTIAVDSTGSTTVSYTVNVAFSEPNELDMLEGMSAEVTLIQKAIYDVIYVNAAAISNIEGTSTVLLKGSDGQGVITEVETGFSDGYNVEIISGLKEGDIVLVESAVSGQ